MKAINEAITVEARKGVPCRFRWEGRHYRTRKLLDYWILQTRWWGREERRIYFRLLTDRGVMEVYRTGTGERRCPTEKSGKRSAGELGGRNAGVRSGNESALRSGQGAAVRPPLPIEGDTHTRERRRTDAVYRPDVRAERAMRAENGGRAKRGVWAEHDVRSGMWDANDMRSENELRPGRDLREKGVREDRSRPVAEERWMLSKIID